MEAILSSPWFWLVVVGGGAIILGAVIAFGQARTSKLTNSEEAVRDAGTRRVYAEEDKRPDL